MEFSVFFLERGDDARVWIRRGGYSGVSMTKAREVTCARRNSYETDARSNRHQVVLLLYIFATMGLGRWLTLLVLHPFEFRILLQFHLYHEQKRDIKALKEHATSGWDRKSMRKCWDFLDQTSRSFSAVIKELDGDLARTVSIV